MSKILLMTVLAIVSCSASADDKDFNRFAEGAMEVYSQFKTPSKAESEKFYGFIQERWNKSVCRNDCGQVGYIVAQQYAKEKKIEIKPKNPAASRKGE